MPFIITVEETPLDPSDALLKAGSLSNGNIERYSQTVETLDLKRLIDAVNPTVRRKRKNAKEVVS